MKETREIIYMLGQLLETVSLRYDCPVTEPYGNSHVPQRQHAQLPMDVPFSDVLRFRELQNCWEI